MREDFSVYMGDEPYVFVSYSHTDWRTVNKIVRILFREEFRLWYDQQGEGISAGAEWKKCIDERLVNCGAFLVFLSNSALERQEVIREFALAKANNKPILPVFLQRVPSAAFPDALKSLLDERQYIGMWYYGGVTEAFAARLLSSGVLTADLVDGAWREARGLPPWDPGRTKSVQLEEDLSLAGEYVYPDGNPVAVTGRPGQTELRFYQVSPGETDPGAVYPMALDNQWCPVSFYEDPRFQKEGFRSDELMRQKLRMQREEFYRALLHALQVVVNRAYLQNSPVFSDWYGKDADKAEKSAFAALLENGTVVSYLYRETMPCDKPGYAVKDQDLTDWQRFCLAHPTYCLRMDWTDDASNEKETGRQLGFPFHSYCVTTAEEPYRLESLAQAFGLSEADVPAFRSRWREIQRAALAFSRTRGKAYTRNQFYTDFLVLPGPPNARDANVVDCLLDPDAPFTRELKQTADLRYNRNLAQAFGLKLLVPEDLQIPEDAMGDAGQAVRRGEVSIEELIYAVQSFSSDFLTADVWTLEDPQFSLDQIVRMRSLPGWRGYIRAVNAGRTRSEQWDIDFSDVTLVWERYHAWMKAVHDTFRDLPWKQEPGALSLIYRFGGKTWTSVYRAGSSRPEWTLRGSSVGTGRVSLTIDYVCGDVFAPSSKNCLKTEIRLFSGVTREIGTGAEAAFRSRVIGERSIS